MALVTDLLLGELALKSADLALKIVNFAAQLGQTGRGRVFLADFLVYLGELCLPSGNLGDEIIALDFLRLEASHFVCQVYPKKRVGSAISLRSKLVYGTYLFRVGAAWQRRWEH